MLLPAEIVDLGALQTPWPRGTVEWSCSAAGTESWTVTSAWWLAPSNQCASKDGMIPLVQDRSHPRSMKSVCHVPRVRNNKSAGCRLATRLFTAVSQNHQKQN